MARLSAFTDSEQLSLDDVLADWDDLPPEGVAAVEKGASGPTIGADPDVIMADLDTQGDVSQAKIGTEPHLDGDCPYAEQCEPRRRKLSTYRRYQKCHWRTFWQWRQCPIYQNGGNGQ